MMELNDGQMFHTITYGQNTMGSHASQISQNDRWKIIQYINKLQGKIVEAAEEGKEETAGTEDTQAPVTEETNG